MRFYTFFFFLFSFHLASGQQANNMTLESNWMRPNFNGDYNDIWGYVDCSGNEYAIIGSSTGVSFVDITNPIEPVEVATILGGDATIWRDIKTYNKYAYSVCDNCDEGLMIFDLSGLPNSVTKVEQTTQWFEQAHNIYIEKETARLYIVGTESLHNGVYVFDLEDNPTAPILIGNSELEGGYVHDINVNENIAFASSEERGLFVYNFTDADNPELIGSLSDYPEKGYNHSSWPSSDMTTLVMADETHDTGLKFLDVSDLSDISVTDVKRSALLAPEANESIAHNPFIRGNYCFVSYYHDGVQVFDITDASDVSQIAGYDTYLSNNGYGGFEGAWGVYPLFSKPIDSGQ